MIKKGGAILLTMLYLVTVLGFALNLHFCLGALASVKIDAPAKTCATVVKKQRKCCKETKVEVKVNDAHEAETAKSMTGLFAIVLPKIPFAEYTFSALQTTLEKPCYRGPPDRLTGKVSIVIKNQNFRI